MAQPCKTPRYRPEGTSPGTVGPTSALPRPAKAPAYPTPPALPPPPTPEGRREETREKRRATRAPKIPKLSF